MCSMVHALSSKDDNEHFKLNSRLMWQIEFSMGYIWFWPGKAAWPTGFMHKGSPGNYLCVDSALNINSDENWMSDLVESHACLRSFYVKLLRFPKLLARKSNRTRYFLSLRYFFWSNYAQCGLSHCVSCFQIYSSLYEEMGNFI